jgi:hypothetical protein
MKPNPQTPGLCSWFRTAPGPRLWGCPQGPRLALGGIPKCHCRVRPPTTRTCCLSEPSPTAIRSSTDRTRAFPVYTWERSWIPTLATNFLRPIVATPGELISYISSPSHDISSLSICSIIFSRSPVSHVHTRSSAHACSCSLHLCPCEWRQRHREDVADHRMRCRSLGYIRGRTGVVIEDNNCTSKRSKTCEPCITDPRADV